MSEREPNSGLHNTCLYCGEDYDINRFNSFMYSYTKQPQIKLLQTDCDNCHKNNFTFMEDYTFETAKKIGVHDTIEEWATPETFKAYLKVMDIPILESQPITPRQEIPIAWLGYLLHHDLVDFNNEGEIL